MKKRSHPIGWLRFFCARKPLRHGDDLAHGGGVDRLAHGLGQLREEVREDGEGREDEDRTEHDQQDARDGEAALAGGFREDRGQNQEDQVDAGDAIQDLIGQKEEET